MLEVDFDFYNNGRKFDRCAIVYLFLICAPNAMFLLILRSSSMCVSSSVSEVTHRRSMIFAYARMDTYEYKRFTCIMCAILRLKQFGFFFFDVQRYYSISSRSSPCVVRLNSIVDSILFSIFYVVEHTDDRS